jgi:hypothetical protein
MKTSMFRKASRGFALFDFFAWTFVALLVVGGIILFAILVHSKANSSNESRELPSVIMGIQNSWNTQPNYTGLTLDAAARGNVWPSNETTIPGSGSATVTDRWGGNVTLTPATITTTNDIARLVYMSVPQTECNDIVRAVGSTVRRIYIDNANSGTAGAGTMVKADGATLSLPAIGPACGTTNSITYDVGH